MKILHTLFVIVTVFMFGGIQAQGSWWPNPDPDIILCQGPECNLQGGVTAAEGAIDGLVTDRTFSEYVIQLIQYLTTFLTLIGVIIVIYAGFTILVSGGDEEKLKSARKLILYAILGIILIWLAFSIMKFIVNILDGTTGPVTTDPTQVTVP